MSNLGASLSPFRCFPCIGFSRSLFLFLTFSEYAPQRGDFSSYLFCYPVKDVDKKGRRLSVKTKAKREYVWVVLDGQLLTWADSVDGKEIGYVFVKDPP